jgi:hypothetical protein
MFKCKSKAPRCDDLCFGVVAASAKANHDHTWHSQWQRRAKVLADGWQALVNNACLGRPVSVVVTAARDLLLEHCACVILLLL